MGGTFQLRDSIEVLAMMLEQFRENQSRVGVLHGLEEFPNSHGRDIDLLVHPEDLASIRDVVHKSFDRHGWQVHSNVLHIGIEQIFGRIVNGDGSHFLEIDLIHSHPFRWRGHEMLDCRLDSSDLFSEGVYDVHPWGWFCKNVLIQILAGNHDKVSVNLMQLKRRPEYIPMIRERGEVLRFGESVELIMKVMDESETWDHSVLVNLQKEVRSAVMRRVRFPVDWLSYSSGLIKWVWRKFLLVFPRARAAPIIILKCDDMGSAERLLDEFQKDHVMRLPFPEIRIRPASGEKTGIMGFINHWLNDRPASAGLVAKVIYGDMRVNAKRADLVIVLNNNCLQKEGQVKSKSPVSADVMREWIGDAFIARLQQHEMTS